MKRTFTREGVHPYDEIRWQKSDVTITNDRGEPVFVQKNVEHPDFWSPTAVKIAASKYFYGDHKVPGARENSVRDLIDRVAKTIRFWGEHTDLVFETADDAQIFEEELTWLLINQFGAFNSPVWFNCGLWHHRRIHEGGESGYHFDRSLGKAQRAPGPYHYPQCSACFIIDIQDDMESILEHAAKEGRLFKFGSGTGTNFSNLRSSKEGVSGGGRASGPLSFMRIFDSVAGAIKSGGKTRRAAKMDILNVTHPDIRDFVWAKKRQEDIGRLLTQKHGFDSSMDGLIYSETLRFQNSNQSVRVTREFMEAVLNDGEFWTRYVTDGQPCEKHKARELMREMAESAWDNAEPGIQFDDLANDWHTCKTAGRINASNPCSEYFFLDNTACNLASLRLTKFLDRSDNFDIESFRAAIRIFFIAQELIVDNASYPTAQICEMSHKYRTIGLGYADVGAMLMALAIPYDSQLGRQFIGALTGIMTAEAYLTSARISEVTGPFPDYPRNRDSMLGVIKKHWGLASRLVDEVREQNPSFERYAQASERIWAEAFKLGERAGYRNAQATVIAPTGTISFLMDCDTTGIEPDFALVKFKSCSGGGYLKIINNMVPKALLGLGYTHEQVSEVFRYMAGTMSFDSVCPINRQTLLGKGLSDAEIDRLNKAVSNTSALQYAVNVWTVGEDAVKRLGFTPEQYQKAEFNLLEELGFTTEEIAESSAVICGRFMIEGAPHVKPEHYNVFNCANACGTGKQYIRPMAHVEMMGYAQRWISGAISKTVNLPNTATIEDIEKVYIDAWKLGVKAIAVYRDGSKGVAPMSTGAKKADGASGSDSKEAANENAEELQKALGRIRELEDQLRSRELELAELSKEQPTTPFIVRRRPPKFRRGETHKFTIQGSHKGYLTVNVYEDGTPCELFLTMNKEGSFASGMAGVFAKMLSLSVQYGIPFEEISQSFKFTRFEPSGFVDNPEIPTAESVVDYVIKYLELMYERAEKDEGPAPLHGSAKSSGFAPNASPTSNGHLDADARALPDEVSDLPPVLDDAPNGHGNGHGSGDSGATSVKPLATRSKFKTEFITSLSMGKYTECPTCSSRNLRQTGSCMACMDCGWSAGCG
ncbi:MAG: adenosylcobalamin-dependent ribonucleoside-diphosphate reductase [Verrucomicrobiae bacterium]|nr:adenosylcobalamin-dependent ribonucleoside-diphosphate reductase [Verrucomicrobiae bacterium]